MRTTQNIAPSLPPPLFPTYKTSWASSLPANCPILACQQTRTARHPTHAATRHSLKYSSPHLGARRGSQRPHVVRKHRVRGQHVVHPGGKDFIGGGFTDVQHVPQVLDLFSRAVSHGDKGRGGRESGTHWYDPHLLGIYGYVVCLPLLQPYYGWRRFSKRQSRVLRAFTGVYNSA